MRHLIIQIWTFTLLLIICSSYRIVNPKQEELTMQYKITGEGNPLVLVPGGLTGWVSWDQFVPQFSSDKKVIQVQLLNVQYGLENKPLPRDYSVNIESRALESALAKIDLSEKADFVGWSYGALVLLDYALNHPEKVRTLTLIEPPAIWTIKHQEEDEEFKKVKSFFASVPATYADIAEKDLENFLAFAGFVKPGESAKSLPQWKGWVNFRQSLRGNSVVIRHHDDLERLRKFNAPVLLVKGTGSAVFLHRIIDTCAKEFPNAQTVEFGGGHAPHLVSKEKFLEALEAFQR